MPYKFARYVLPGFDEAGDAAGERVGDGVTARGGLTAPVAVVPLPVPKKLPTLVVPPPKAPPNGAGEDLGGGGMTGAVPTPFVLPKENGCAFGVAGAVAALPGNPFAISANSDADGGSPL